MNLRQIEAFQAVVETRSMTKAAARLRISQPNISRLISDLERSVGFKLFERLPGRQLLTTDDAMTLHTEVERSFIALSHISEVAADIRRGKGRVRIVASAGVGRQLAPSAIRLFSAKYPETAITLQMATTDIVLAMLASQRADLGLIGGFPDLRGFDKKPLLYARGTCAVPAAHRLARRAVLRPADFQGERFISHPAEDHLRQQIDAIFNANKVTRILAIETRFSETMCALVSEGLGVAIVNPIIAANAVGQGIKFVRFSIDIPLECQLVFMSQRPRSRLTIFLSECFQHAAEELFSSRDNVKLA
jgi:DNA-binding transcriptional LysR family regulator